MLKKRYVRAAVLLLLAGAISIQLGCGRGSRSENGEDDETVVVPVEVAEVTLGDIASYFTGTATLEAEKETEVVAKVGGVVARIYAEEGDFIRAGRTLAKLDDEKLAVQMAQATANFKKLETEYERSVELYEAKLISDQEFQRVKFEYESQKASYDLRQLDLEYTSIRSPISGVVSERMVKVGNMVVANTPVFRVTDLDPLLAVLHVPERLIGELRVGQPATLRVDAIADAEFSGRVERISPVVDPSTGTVKVTVEVHDTSLQLKPGMFARINIVNDIHTAAVLAPREAIIEEDDESRVFVVRDSTAYRQTVETGYVNSVHIEILSGLASGDTVVTTGKGSLKDSSRVDMVSPYRAEADVSTEEDSAAATMDVEEGADSAEETTGGDEAAGETEQAAVEDSEEAEASAAEESDETRESEETTDSDD